MFRIAIMFKSGEHFGKNFKTRAECDQFILEQKDIKRAVILDKETGKREWIKF